MHHIEIWDFLDASRMRHLIVYIPFGSPLAVKCGSYVVDIGGSS